MTAGYFPADNNEIGIEQSGYPGDLITDHIAYFINGIGR